MAKTENLKMSIAQYDDLRKAQKVGNTARAERICQIGYQKDYTPDMADTIEAEIIEDTTKVDVDAEDVLNDVAGGLSNKEIYAKYGISPKKLSMIKKDAA